MRNALDTFKAQQEVVEILHARLTEVAAVVSGIKSQVDALRVGEDLRRTLETEQQWLIRTDRLLRDVRDWNSQEFRQAQRALRLRWVMPLVFAFAASAATGIGLLWAWHPYAAELARLQTEAEFAELVENRVTAMTPTERQEFERLMKLSPAPRR